MTLVFVFILCCSKFLLIGECVSSDQYVENNTPYNGIPTVGLLTARNLYDFPVK